MRLKYYRHATFLLKIDNSRILVDPMYMKKGCIPPVPSTPRLQRNPLENFPEKYPKMSAEDVLLITHHHFDHFDSVAAKKLSKQLSIVTPANGFKRLRRKGFRKIIPMHPGQELDIKGFKIHAVPVKHTQRLQGMLYKPGLGYLIQYSKGTIYISGDTILFKELPDCLNKFRLDLAIFYGGAARIPLLGRHTLSAEEILSLIKDINPRNSAIIHLNALNHCTESCLDVRKWLDSADLSAKVILPLPGEECVFDFL